MKQLLDQGHAIWSVCKCIGDEPFAVLLDDDIMKNYELCLAQLMHQYEQTGNSVSCVQQVASKDTHRYGIIDPISVEGKLIGINHFVEKPIAGTAPSNYVIMGRYILTPGIFDFLGEHHLGAGRETQLTDAIQKLNEIQSVYA